MRFNWKFWNRKESIDTLPPSSVTSQKSVETEQFLPIWMRPNFGLIHPFDLNAYLTLYVNDSLAYAIVNADTNLTVSPFVYECSDDSLNEWLEDWARKIDLSRIVWELQRDISLFGFCIAEILGDTGSLQTSSNIVAIKRLDPRFIFIQKDRQGRIEKVRQRWTIGSNVGTSLLDTELDPETIIYCHSLSPLTSYGQSILQALKARLLQRNELLDATIQAHKNHANAVNWLKYLSNPEREELQSEIQRQVDSLKNATEAIDKNSTRWLLSGGSGSYEYTRLGAGELPDASNVLKEITNDIIVSAGFSPSILGLGQDQKNNESVRYTVNSILTRQQNLMSQLHATLFSKLPFLVNDCPADTGADIRISMESPTSETAKEKLEAEAILINNASLKLKSGVITPDGYARELGYESFPEENKGILDNYMNVNKDVNQKDPNQVQQVRKSLDTLNDGVKPSNNPSGEQK